MPSAQFPLWVTYSLACIAILGPIGGALFGAGLTARRDDRRWDREKQRDDLRWEREQERQRELKIFEERKIAYGQALVATTGWFGQLNSRYNRLIGALGLADRPAEIER